MEDKMLLTTMKLKRIWNKFATPRDKYVTPSSGNELSHAIREKKHDLVNYLIDKSIKIDVERHNGSPLRAAMAMADIDLVKKLINKGVELNYQEHRLKDNPYYFSPLHWAQFYFLNRSREGKEETQFDIIKTLINAGADVNGLSSQNISILGSVMMKLDSNVFQHYNPLIPEMKKEGDYDSSKEYRLIELLANKGADLDKNCNQANLTPLTTASKAGEISILKLLLNKGADINKIDGSGKSALHYAVEEDNVEIFNFLLSQGANKFIKDSNNNTPLDCVNGKIEQSISLENNTLGLN